MALREIKVNNKYFNISYEILNSDKKENIIFLHGWGANKEIMKVFKNYFKDFRHIYIDMPGFGKSSNKYVLTTKEYAEVINFFLEDLAISKDIIVAHSFGGKVATLLSPKLLVLLASAGIVLPKPLMVRIKIAIYKFLKPFGVSKFKEKFISSDVKGMSQNMYETFKNVVDEDFSEEFKNFKGKVLIFGGTNDSAIPYEAIKEQGKLFKSDIIMLNGGHYFFFNDEEAKVNREIIEFNVVNHPALKDRASRFTDG